MLKSYKSFSGRTYVLSIGIILHNIKQKFSFSSSGSESQNTGIIMIMITGVLSVI